MLAYVSEVLTISKHNHSRKPQDQPYLRIKPTHDIKAQYAEDADVSPPLRKEDKKGVQEFMGKFLYYSRAVDVTMLAALGSIAEQQANPTEQIMQKVKQFLDYAATHIDEIIAYHASDMVLAGHSDASYLSKTKSRIRACGHFFMSNNTYFLLSNVAVLTVAKIIKAVVSSASEAELGALSINCKEAIPTRQAMEEMGHKQPPTPMQIDNTTAHGVITNNIVSKRLKSMGMGLYWL